MRNLLTPNRTNPFVMLDRFERDLWSDTLNDVTRFRTDIVDKGECYELQAELPGFDKESINIDINDNQMVISATQDVTSEDNTDNYVRRERRVGKFSRSFDVSDINTDGINASFENGVLKLQLPKKDPKASLPQRQIEIQ